MQTPKKLLTSMSLALALGGAALVAGCGGGSDSGGGSDDPLAKAAPADALFVLEGTVRPSAEQTQSLNQIGANFPGGGADIGQLIQQKIDEGLAGGAVAARGGPAPTFATDIDPWLGDRALVFVTDSADSAESTDSTGSDATATIGDDQDGTVVAEVKDDEAAKAAIAKIDASQGSKSTPSDVQGVQVNIDEDGDAAAVDNGLFFAGNEDGVKAAIAAAKGDGDTLADNGDFGDAVDRVDGNDALAFMYVNTSRFIDLAASETEVTSDTSSDDAKKFFDAVGVDESKPVSVSINPDGDTLRAKIAAPSAGEGDNTGELLDALPADSTVAFGIPEIGAKVGQGFDVALDASASEEGTSPDQAQNQKDLINNLLGVKVDELGDSIGDGALFVTGTNEKDLKIGLVADVTDADTIGEAVNNVKSLIGSEGPVNEIQVPGAQTAFSVSDPSSPLPIEIAFDGKKLAIGGGTGAAALALAPPSTLADAPALGDLGGSLDGADPSAFADIPALLKLLQATGATDDPDYAEVAPYLGALGQFAAGSTGEEDGYAISNAALTFQPSK